MLAPLQPLPSSGAADFEAILAQARLEALTILRRLLTDPPESPAAARELRMAASAILRIAPEPRLNEPRAPAMGHASEPNANLQSPTRAPKPQPLSTDPLPRPAEPARRQSRRDRRAAAALRARSGASNSQNSS